MTIDSTINVHYIGISYRQKCVNRFRRLANLSPFSRFDNNCDKPRSFYIAFSRETTVALSLCIYLPLSLSQVPTVGKLNRSSQDDIIMIVNIASATKMKTTMVVWFGALPASPPHPPAIPPSLLPSPSQLFSSDFIHPFIHVQHSSRFWCVDVRGGWFCAPPFVV